MAVVRRAARGCLVLRASSREEAAASRRRRSCRIDPTRPCRFRASNLQTLPPWTSPTFREAGGPRAARATAGWTRRRASCASRSTRRCGSWPSGACRGASAPSRAAPRPSDGPPAGAEDREAEAKRARSGCVARAGPGRGASATPSPPGRAQRAPAAPARDRLRPAARRDASRSTCAFRTRPGATVRLGDYFGKQPGGADPRLLRLPDALHRQPERPRERPRHPLASTPGQEFEVVTVSFDPKETPALAAAKKKALPRALQAARGRRRAGTSSPATPRRSTALTQRRRLPLRLGRRARSSSRIPRASSSLTPDGRRSRATSSASSTRPRTCAWPSSRPRATARSAASWTRLLLSCYQYDPHDRPLQRRDHAA